MATDLVCNAGQIAISDMITGINERIGPDEYATDVLGGTVKMKVDATDPADIILYITNDGSTPGA